MFTRLILFVILVLWTSCKEGPQNLKDLNENGNGILLDSVVYHVKNSGFREFTYEIHLELSKPDSLNKGLTYHLKIIPDKPNLFVYHDTGWVTHLDTLVIKQKNSTSDNLVFNIKECYASSFEKMRSTFDFFYKSSKLILVSDTVHHLVQVPENMIELFYINGQNVSTPKQLSEQFKGTLR